MRNPRVSFLSSSVNAPTKILFLLFLTIQAAKFFSREDIERAHVNFYTDLFSPEAIDDSCTRELLDSVSRTLSPADRELCEENISLAELADASIALV